MTTQGLLNDELAAWDRDCPLHPASQAAKHVRGDMPGRIRMADNEVAAEMTRLG